MRDPFFDDPDEPAPAVREYAAEVWLYRRFVLAAAVAAGVIAGISLLTPKTFVATTTLAATGSKIGDAPTAVSPRASSDHREPRDSRRSHQGTWSRWPALQTDAPIRFFRVVSVSVVRISNLIKVTARLRDPELSAKIANEVANRGVALATVVSRQEAVRARADIAEHMADLRTKMEAASQRLLAFKRTTQVKCSAATCSSSNSAPIFPSCSATSRRSAAASSERSASWPRDKVNITTKSTTATRRWKRPETAAHRFCRSHEERRRPATSMRRSTRKSRRAAPSLLDSSGDERNSSSSRTQFG
jgi:hypothetical protein